jgi:hypothetical protein
MAEYTTNYNLAKPADNDAADIGVINDNMDLIDNAIAAHAVDYTLQVPYGGTTSNSGNAYSITSPVITALSAGMAISVKINDNSTGAATLNWNNTGAKSIKKANGVAVSNLKAGGIYTLRYDGTNFILQGSDAAGDATAADLLAGKTASTDAGDITGTMTNNGAVTITPGTVDQAIPSGYHNGSGKVFGDTDLISANIKSGINIFGVAGNSNVVDTSAGDATAAQILSGKKAYVDGALVTGTISSKAAATITPGTTNQTIAAGQYLSGAQTISGDADLAAANIKKDINIFGVTGTFTCMLEAGDFAIGSATTTQEWDASAVLIKKKEIKMLTGGIIRVSFTLYNGGSVGGKASGQIYINDIAVGTLREIYTSTVTTFTEDFSVVENDLVQLYAGTGYGGHSMEVSNFLVKTKPYATVTLD